MIHYLSKAEVAEHLGVSLNTIKAYDAQGRMPEADARVGRNHGWLVETIDAWNAARPGSGVRTDCAHWTTDPDTGKRVTCERDQGHRGKHRRTGDGYELEW